MIAEWVTINPELPYKDKADLLWMGYMRSSGWMFLDETEARPSKFETVLFATGDREEWLMYLGWLVDEDYTDFRHRKWTAGTWQHQNCSPDSRQEVTKVIAWKRIETPESFSKIEFQTVIGNDFISRMCGVKLLSNAADSHN